MYGHSEGSIEKGRRCLTFKCVFLAYKFMSVTVIECGKHRRKPHKIHRKSIEISLSLSFSLLRTFTVLSFRANQRNTTRLHEINSASNPFIIRKQTIEKPEHTNLLSYQLVYRNWFQQNR